jgi:hypothetical protein
MAFLCEYVRDFSIRPAAPAKFVDQLAVRLKARARRFLWDVIQNVLKPVVHWSPFGSEPSPNAFAAGAQRARNNYATSAQQDVIRSDPRDPKPKA